MAAGDPWHGTLAAHAAFALAAGRAAARATGPGTLGVLLLDELAALAPEDLAGAELAEEPVAGGVSGGSETG